MTIYRLILCRMTYNGISTLGSFMPTTLKEEFYKNKEDADKRKEEIFEQLTDTVGIQDYQITIGEINVI